MAARKKAEHHRGRHHGESRAEHAMAARHESKAEHRKAGKAAHHRGHHRAGKKK